ncbi:MAG: AAA family ATPase, partial [Gammaproteobacteria bacterium]|nr:AAA family ATPase [Gammaproteobacteria bacterium]
MPEPASGQSMTTPTAKTGDTASPGDELPPGIFIPKPQPDFWVSEAVGRELFVIGKISSRGEPVNVKVVGPAGVGKTTLAWEFAAAYKRPCFEIHFGMYSDPSEIWGRDRLSMEKGTFYETARLVDAIETENCVVVCDEPNRCHPEVLNNMFSLWDWRRAAWVPALQRMVRVAPGVVFFAAMNEGAEYMGTNPLDRAIRERFGRTIRLKWPPAKAEAKIIQKRTGVAADIAEKLARFA